MKPLTLAEQLSAIESTREEGALALLPVVLADGSGVDQQEALAKARIAWDAQNAGPAAVRSFLIMTLGQLKAQDDFQRHDEWRKFCIAVRDSTDVDLIPIDDFSSSDRVLLDHAGLVINGKPLPPDFFDEIQADGPLQESSMPDRFAELLALRFFMAVCTLPANPNPVFQSALKEAALAGEGADIKLRGYASNMLRHYVKFLGTLPEITALASLKHFVHIAESPAALEVTAPYCGSAQVLADRGPDYNVGKDLIAAVVLNEAQRSPDAKHAKLHENYLIAIMRPTASIEETVAATSPTFH